MTNAGRESKEKLFDLIFARYFASLPMTLHQYAIYASWGYEIVETTEEGDKYYYRLKKL